MQAVNGNLYIITSILTIMTCEHDLAVGIGEHNLLFACLL